MAEEKPSGTEEEKIKEAETEPIAESDQKKEAERRKKTDAYIEFGLIFILGLLIGIAIKTEAGKRITIGFDDYQMKLAKQDFNINKLQFEVTKRNMESVEGGQTESSEAASGN